MLGRERRIPSAKAPDPAHLIAFPGEEAFPPELRDRAVFDSALAEGSRARAAPRTPAAHDPAVAVQHQDTAEPIRNVVLVSHCNFKGNSAFHVLAVARELHARGLSPVIAVPDEPVTVDDLGRPPFLVLTYEDAASGGALRFPDGRGPDLVHAWTPRELVRRVTVDLVRSHACRYVVHLEDNEEAVLSAEHGGIDVSALKELPTPLLDRIVRPRQTHPHRAARFLEQSAGMTVLVERLLELVPAGVPATVVPAGFDEAVLAPRRPREEVRAGLRVGPDELAIVYPGNIHLVNMEEMRSLYEAVALVRKAGLPVVLVKTGWGSTQTVDFPRLGAGVRDLGWVAREAIPELLAAADLLVQPGGPDSFNDYRFPSKLPEFLASGRPVVLPRTNVGLLLRNGEEALLLERGDAHEIAAAVTRLASDPALRARLGEGGRAFALRELRWSESAESLLRFYTAIGASGRSAPPGWALDGVDPPVKVVARTVEAPTAADAELARSHGIYAFWVDEPGVGATRDFRACRQADGRESNPLDLRIRGGRDAFENRFAVAAEDSRYSALLRKRVLRALLLADVEDAIVFVDATSVWPDRALRWTWLAATRTGLGEGIRQYYASRSLVLGDAEIDALARAT